MTSPPNLNSPPILDYLPKQPQRAITLAIAWLKGMACCYALFTGINIFAMVNVSPPGPLSAGERVQQILTLLLMSSTAIIFWVTARRLRRGTPRWHVLALWTIAFNVVWIAMAVAELLWITFGGVVDPGVPLFGLAGSICLVLFAFLFLGPLLYYLLKARSSQPTT